MEYQIRNSFLSCLKLHIHIIHSFPFEVYISTFITFNLVVKLSVMLSKAGSRSGANALDLSFYYYDYYHHF